MRIPSQFNEDSLYRQGPRRGESAHGMRRLVRLALGLILVLVVMKQAARPEIYRAFFGGNEVSVVAVAPVGGGPGAVPERILEPVEIATDDRAIANRLTGELLPSDRRQWVVTLSRWQTLRPVRMVPSTIDTVRSDLSVGDRVDPTRVSHWQGMLDAIERSVESGEQVAPDSIHLSPLNAWLAALDDFSAADVVDGIWGSGDFDAFYRYLDQSPYLSPQNVAATGVVPLLQQPDVYRSRVVKAGGRVARAEKMSAEENAFGITEYWKLWLRPNDGADRPLLAIVADVPPEIAAVGSGTTNSDGPPVAIVGRFLKGLAYQSEMGADLAPVVVGRLLTAPQVVTTATKVEPGTSGTTRLFWTLLLAGLLGVAIAGITMWRTTLAGNRVRELRTKNRRDPDDFLEGLAGHEEEEK